MPKALSLKKAQQNAPPKNQKAITQFFKNSNVPATQKSQSSPAKSQISQENGLDRKSSKRKILSPEPSETIEILDDNDAFIGKSTQDSMKLVSHSPKKQKFYHNDQHTSRTSKVNIKSPLKENSIGNRTSPRKGTIELSMKSEVLITTVNDVEILDQDVDRLPLTPVKNTNVDKESSDKALHINNSELIKVDNNIQGNVVKVKTPKKVFLFDNHDHTNIQSPTKSKRTPKKSPKQAIELRRSPRIAKISPVKVTKEEQSPSKKGSTVKALDFSDGVNDMFDDEWDIGDVDEDTTEDLDLTTMQRCEVISVTKHPSRLELRLKNAANKRATCFVDGIWLDTPLSVNEIVSVLATRDASGRFYIGNSNGLLVLRPDHLMSATSVVSAVFCKRKALLQERWKGIDPANTAMTIGILIHELVQKALTERIMDITKLRLETDKIIKESVQMLYNAGLAEEETRNNMQAYISPLAEFMQTYVDSQPPIKKQTQKDQWTGHIDKVLDIEENLCCPQLGLKGKIDATLEVTIHERHGNKKAVVPLELKSGKASVSAEHRGQLVLYGMMVALQQGEDPSRAFLTALLLYLKDRVEVREVSCGYPERRDLVLLRNQLAQHLAAGPDDIDPEQVTDIEDASLLQHKLPDPVHHQTACAKCPYLTICSLHLWHTEGPSVSETHPLSKLREQALGHLSTEHIKYFLHWTALLRMEERGQMVSSPLHSLWTDSVEKRSKRGTCAANLKLKSVKPSGDRFLHVFDRCIDGGEPIKASSKTKGPQEGEFSIVSVENRPWVAAGVVVAAKERDISILLERDLSSRLGKAIKFHIDTYESYASTVQNLTNLGVLLEDSDRALRLRKLIIDKETPQFEKKLSRDVGRLGTKLMRSLNIQQQRAVLRALAAKDYALLQGLPGTGKTQTISVLIQMLVGLKQRVLVTAHTHSAVDNVLSRLPDTMKVMRLGSSARVSPSLLSRCEQQLAASCDSPLQLQLLYDSMEVVGVTCLGAAHGMLARSRFDVCVVDEATQVLQCTVLRPLLAATRFVLVGDPEQLPPVVRSRAARRLGMEESLFHRLMNEEATSTLQLQYRMNQALVDIANKVAYSSRLKCADLTIAQARLNVDVKKLSIYTEESWLQSACSPEPSHAAMYIDTATMDHSAPREDHSCANTHEACLVLALVDAATAGGVKASEIGVIAPYRDQVSLLRAAISRRGAEVSTVDQFQGRDKSLILFSCCKREGQDRKIKEGEILNDQRRLAVSVTRAKHKFIVVGNSRALQRYEPLQRLINACTPLAVDKDVLSSVVDKYKKEFV